MASLICGSLAYDKIMLFEGRFGEHILSDHVHILNVSFLVPTMRQEFGGCAGNIAYALRMLGGDARIMATLGEIDGAHYLERLRALGLSTQTVRLVEGENSAQAMITTDLDNNQITAFHPGAMMHSHLNRVSEASGISLGIVAPDGAQGMESHTEQFAAAGIPFVFDPGQGLPLFSGEALARMIDRADYVAVNDYEAKLLTDKTGWSVEKIASRLKAFVITCGADGAQILHDGKIEQIPAVAPPQVVDPTGCGDAFRGGLLYGIENGMDWATTGRLASLMGSLKVAVQGPQNYSYSREAIGSLFRKAFGYSAESLPGGLE